MVVAKLRNNEISTIVVGQIEFRIELEGALSILVLEQLSF